MNNKTDNIRVTVNRNDLDATNLLSKISVNSFGIPNLAIEEIYTLFPEYRGFTVSGSQKYDEYYVLNLGPSL